MPVLSSAEIEKRLLTVPEWRLVKEELVRSFTFADFAAAMRFVNSVATMAESEGHHPDIDIRYNKVILALSSHDAGGITGRDFHLASEIDHAL